MVFNLGYRHIKTDVIGWRNVGQAVPLADVDKQISEIFPGLFLTQPAETCTDWVANIPISSPLESPLTIDGFMDKRGRKNINPK